MKVRLLEVMEDLAHERKSLVKQAQIIFPIYAYNSYLFLNGKKIKFKADSENNNFLTQFCLWIISNGFSATESRDVSLNGNVYDVSVDYNSFDKSDLLNIHKYLLTKSNLK